MSDMQDRSSQLISSAGKTIAGWVFFSVMFVLFSGPALCERLPALSTPPLGERWFSVSMDGEQTGFSRQRIGETPTGYEVQAEGSVKMLVMGFSREASSREEYVVARDLSLVSFSLEQVIDGSRMKVEGETTPQGVAVTVETAGAVKKKLLKAKGKVYPPAVLNMYPFFQGKRDASSFRVQMLDVEAVKIKEVKITVIGTETLPDGMRALHLQNDLYPFVSNDIWVDLAGNTLRESVRDGLVETAVSDDTSSRRFIAAAAIAKKDLILDFSLVRIEHPLRDPASLKRLVLRIDKFPVDLPLLQGAGQVAVRHGEGRVLFTVTPQSGAESAKAEPLSSGERERYLAPAARLPADHPEIAARKAEIVGEEKAPDRIVERLTRWVATSIANVVTDSQSPLETLKVKQGNCQAHARLYVSLARAAGVPTRFVSGLVYADGKGFLYHSWAESFVAGRWIKVDPTFGQVPADATHIKLVEGDGPDEMSALAGVVGRITAQVVEQGQ